MRYKTNIDTTVTKKKRINVAMDEQLHREMSAAAALMGMTKTDYVIMAVEEKLGKKTVER